MPAEFRFDDLDLREEAFRADTADASDHGGDRTYICSDTCSDNAGACTTTYL
jgi:hypothetical protein